MRLLIAGLAALGALALAAPSNAQETSPAPTTKPAKGTAAYCNTLKSKPQRSACLKRVHAHASSATKPGPHKGKAAKKPEPTPPKQDTSAEMTPPAAAPTPPPTATSTVAVPPLPQKTI